MNIAILFAVIALIGYGATDLLIKKAMNKDYFYSVALLRTFITPLILFFILIFSSKIIFPSINDLLILLLIGFIGAVAYYYYTKALATEWISIMSAMTKTSSIICVFLAVIILKEALSVVQILGIVMIIGGAIALSYKKGIGKQLKSIKNIKYIIITIILWGIMYFLLYYPSKSLGGINSAFYFEGMVFVFMIPFLFLDKVKKISDNGLKLTIIAGTLNAFATLGYMLALTMEKVAIVTPIIGATPLFVVIFARIFLKEKLKLHQIISVLVIILGLFLLSLRAVAV